MKNILLLFILLISNYKICFGNWGLPGTYLNWGAGARSLGMGKAYVGLADDASAVYWNPAGISQISAPEILLLHTMLFENTNYNFFGFVSPIPFLFSSLGIGYVMLSSTDFEERPKRNEPIGKFNIMESAFLTSYSHQISKKMHLGGTLKVIKQQIGNYSKTSIGLDLGVLYFLKKHISVGIKLQNLIPPSIRLLEDTENYPFGIRGGTAVRLLGNRLIVSVDAMKQMNQKDVKLYSGIEYNLLNNFFIRLGMDETEITGGFGIRYKMFLFDYAVGLQSLGFSHRFSVNLRFGDISAKIKSNVKEFSPFGTLKTIKLKLHSRGIFGIKKWKLIIKDKEDTVVRIFQGRGKPPKEINWDATNEEGNLVKDGTYRCILYLTDMREKSQMSNILEIKIVTAIPDRIIEIEKK